MKKSIFIVVLGMVAAGLAYGQGQVNFLNYYSASQTTGVSYGNGPDAGMYVGPEMNAILLWGASTATSISQLQVVAGSETPFGLGVATGPGALQTGSGWFSGPTVSINNGTAGSYAFAIEATGTLNGITYTGYSPIVVGPTQSSSTANVPNLPDTLYKGSFSVFQAVPEPATMALGGLGLASLLVFRRKKA